MMHTFPAANPVTLEVRNASGDVQITLTDTDTATVEVTLKAAGAFGFVDEIVRAFGGRHEDAAEQDRDRRSRWWEAPSGSDAEGVLNRVRVERLAHDDGDTLIVDTDPASRGWRTAFGVRVTAPAGSGVRVNSQSADVTVTGTASRLDIRSASGDVIAGDVQHDARIQTASGDVRVQAVGGDLSCRSASGDLEVSAVGGMTSMHTTSGDVLVQTPAGDLEVRTVSGDVRIADLASGLTQITAVSGDIEIGVHPGSLAAVSLSTISGDTRSDLHVTDRPGEDGGTDDQPEGVAADPAGPTLDIRARTTSGDIRLRRAAVTG